MARTQAADYDEKRETITREAAKLFAKKGFAGASISELAEKCNVSKSLIYHYYDSKEAILYDVMSSHIDELLDVVEESSALKSDCLEKLRLLTKELLRKYVGAVSHHKVLLYELGSLPNNLRTEIVDKQRVIISYVEELVKESIQIPKAEQKRLKAKVMLYFGMLNWTHTWYKPSGPINREELADIACNMLIDSFKN